MNRTLLAAAAALLFSASAQADNFTQKNTDKAKHLIDLAVEAHGGEALLDGLQTLAIEHETVNHAVGQSRGTEPPWDTGAASGVDAIDLAESVFVTRTRGTGGGFAFDNATIINGDDSAQLDYRAGTVAPIAEPDFDTTSGPFVRVTPALLVRTLKAREANAYYLGEVTRDGETFDVVGFSMTVGPAISLYLERDTHRVRRSERVFPGFGLVEYEFDDYETFDGIPLNTTFTLYLNGERNLERDIVSVRVNEPLDEVLEIDPALAEIPAVTPNPLARYDVADGVWLIGGSGTYAMFVDMGDYVFAAGGTAGIPDRIELLREAVGDKPIRYGMLTHHHFDHVLGVKPYEEEGATVIAAAAHESIVRDAAEAPDELRLRLVDDRLALETDARRVEIIDIGPTPHTEHLLVAYLPAEGILFEADHFGLPQTGPIPPAQESTRAFAEALARLDIDVDTILSAHSPRIATTDDLQTALEAETFAARVRQTDGSARSMR